MKRININVNTVLVGVVISMQAWILLEIVSMRDRLTKVETKIEWWRQSN